jgi:uncharacterized membrane protein
VLILSQRYNRHFETNPQLGILAFQEVKGIYPADDLALLQAKNKTSFYTKDFVVVVLAESILHYQWSLRMDIYGRNLCVAFEVLDTGYTIFSHRYCSQS